MPSSRFTTLCRRHLVWLLGLVLLLPLAQTAATLHLLSHVHTGQSEHSDGDHGVLVDHCELDDAAAAIAGGALPVQSISSTAVVAPTTAPAIRSSIIWIGRLLRPYESRAPPPASY